MNAGDVVGGRYRLVEPVASGGMGTVWRARHIELEVDVAVKVMSDALLRAPTALARFQREARAAAQLRSPHVVQVFDYGVHGGQPYLAMELLEGEDLRSHLERTGPLPLGRAAELLDALAKALRLAHAAGIVHRDLKPANIFLHRSGDDEVLKILDFGIAKDLGPQVDGLRTSTSTVVGSPLYMSPEQVRGGEVDQRTDLWSLATIAFEMVTGRHPFEGASLGDVFARIVADAIPRPTSIAPGLPSTLDAFFEHALARGPADRPGSATELAAAFRASIGDHAATTAPRGAPVSRARGDGPTIAAPAGTGSGERERDAPAGGEDDVGSAPTERPDGWPTSAGARTAPRAEAIGRPSLPPTAPGDPGPLAERRPRRRGRAPGALVALAVAVAVGVVVAAVWRSEAPAPGPPPDAAAAREPAVEAAREGRVEPSAAPPTVTPATAAAPMPSASAPPPAASSLSAAAPISTPAAVPGTARPPGGAATRPAPSPPSAAPPAAPPTMDPIFGVPVGAP